MNRIWDTSRCSLLMVLRAEGKLAGFLIRCSWLTSHRRQALLQVAVQEGKVGQIRAEVSPVPRALRAQCPEMER